MPQESALLPWIVAMPLVGAILNGCFGRFWSKKVVTAVGVGVIAVSFAFALAAFFTLKAIPTVAGMTPALTVDLWSWISTDTLTINVAFLLDPLSAVMVLIVTGVGGLIHVFSVGYMWKDESYHRYFSYLNLFMFSMLLLVLGKNLLILFVGWEGVGVCSYLLIGFWFTDMQKAIAGKKAFIVNRIGDFGFLIGIFLLLFYSQGDLDFVRLAGLFDGGALDPSVAATAQQATDRTAVVTMLALLFLVGVCGKSAQIPLFVWLPDAMAGPTPVSALIHAATMVTAGVYMMCRMSYMYGVSDVAMTVVATIGAATALFAATIALVQNDIKKVLAYSTVSQLGFMVLAVGVGAFTAAVFHLMTHAFFKACLFLGSGSVIHGMHHEQDIRMMGGLKKKMPLTALTFFISCLAIAGIPLFAGFFSKDEILFVAFTSSHHGMAPQTVLFGVALLAAFLTAFYMFRLYYLTFEGEFRGDKHTYDHAHEESVMTGPLLVLALLATVAGFVGLPAVTHLPHVLGEWLQPVFASASGHFTYSHDYTLEVILMAISVAVGLSGWMIARKMYRVPAAQLPTAPTQALWHRVLMNKWYVDEFYDLVIVRPLKATADFCYRVLDKKVIDGGMVHGTARLFTATGNGLRRLQNGDIQTYVTVVLFGVAILLSLAL
jgi:NADH-quinone oxidoreductase subunit L